MNKTITLSEFNTLKQEYREILNLDQINAFLKNFTNETYIKDKRICYLSKGNEYIQPAVKILGWLNAKKLNPINPEARTKVKFNFDFNSTTKKQKKNRSCELISFVLSGYRKEQLQKVADSNHCSLGLTAKHLVLQALEQFEK